MWETGAWATAAWADDTWQGNDTPAPPIIGPVLGGARPRPVQREREEDEALLLAVLL